ncbi:AAA family ATPase [Serratia symbiotica]|nr:AAA family ATPase [Serratia symbiotica]
MVEGIDGWRVLINDLHHYSEWVVQEQLPVVLIVGIKQCCVRHALLIAQSIINDGLTLLGWVANRINPGLSHYAATICALQQCIPVPLLSEVPNSANWHTTSTSHCFSIDRHNDDMKQFTNAVRFKKAEETIAFWHTDYCVCLVFWRAPACGTSLLSSPLFRRI